ncbi:amino acid permease [Crystallibacter degradans]|uniref:amino acid permease n=1 Tax=Crystallibacter degradans TaxID=2726743 RepID=UPI001475BD0B|nr:APC family permease [Arthrobacter sp. SF27]
MSVSSPPTIAPQTKTDAPRLSGRLGVASVVLIVVAAASPLGVIGGTVPLAIASGNGAGLPFIYLLATGILLLFSVGFTTMTPHVPTAGAFYSYIEKGLGRRAGLGGAFVALLSYLALEAGVYGLFAPAVDEVVRAYGGPSLPWWFWAAAALAAVAWLGHRNIEVSGKVLAVLLVAEVVIVLVLDGFIVFGGGGPEGLSTGFVTPSTVLSGAPGIALLFAILSFIGFEATAIFRDEARDPDKTIPRATYLALIVVGGFYALSTWLLISVWGDGTIVQKATDAPGTLLSETTALYLGTAGSHIVQVLLATSLFACILSFHNIGSRYFFQLAGQDVFPRKLARTHARHNSPHLASIADNAVVALFLLTAVVAGWDPIVQFYTWFAGFASLGIVVLMTLTSVAVLVFFRRRQTAVTDWKRSVAPALGFVGLLGILVLILQNLPSLVGNSTALAVAVVVLILACFAAGAVIASRRAGEKRQGDYPV